MNKHVSVKQPTHLERISDSCLAFRLDKQFISDNNYLFIAPNGNFCRACFQRRYLTQMMNEVKNINLHNSVLNLAIKLDRNYKNKSWQAYSVANQKLILSFELTPYEDCPVCGKQKNYSKEEARVLYKKLFNKESISNIEALEKQVFSFGFARKLATTKKTGLSNPEFDQLLGNNHEAKIVFRMLAPDRRFADDSAIGFDKVKNLAELKSLMEYIERYAFMMQLCRFKTGEYDDQIISTNLALYRKKSSQNELREIRSNAAWGINLLTEEIHAIPLSFIFNRGQISFLSPTSSGFAAHTDFSKSLCSSILEIVERDAFIRFWHDPQRAFHFKPNEDIKSNIDNIISIIKPVVDNENVVGNFFVIQSPTKLPVVLITISSEDFSKPPSLCFGCGTGFNLDDAILGAIEELRQNTINLIKGVTVIDGFLNRSFTSKVETIADRMNFYSTSIPRSKLRFLDNDNPLINGIVKNTEQPDLDVLVNRFKQIGFDIYGLDCTPLCFRDKNVYVTRAFSPQLYPMQFEKDDAYKITTGILSAHKELPHFFI